MVENGLNGLSKKRERTALRIIEAIKEAHGLLTLAAAKSGIGYTTIRRYVAELPSVAEAVREAKEGMLDIAEGKLYMAISNGEAWAICFYLKTQGKHRGFSERQEITGAGGKPLEVDIDYKTKLLGAIARYDTDGEAGGDTQTA